MTVRDPELIELLADKPDLLAITDAVSETQRGQFRPGRRRLLVRAGFAVAVAAAVVVALLVAPSGKHGIVDRAAAAFGDGPIMHIVAEVPTGTVIVNLKTGERTVQYARFEFWTDQQMHRFHLVLSVNGQVGDVLLPEDAQKGASLSGADPAFIALWSGYRAALKNGTAKIERSGTIDGHTVYWLRFDAAAPNQHGSEIAVDAQTYKPVIYRSYLGSQYVDARILTAETIGYDPSEFTRRGQSLVGGLSSSGSGTGPISASGTPNTTIKPPWLTAGETVAGLKLSAANPLTATRNVNAASTSIQGIELIYGPISLGGTTENSTTIDELPSPEDPTIWTAIPADAIAIQTAETTSSQNGTHRVWIGYVKKDGIYITISTPISEEAVLAIARSLHAAK